MKNRFLLRCFVILLFVKNLFSCFEHFWQLFGKIKTVKCLFVLCDLFGSFCRYQITKFFQIVNLWTHLFLLLFYKGIKLIFLPIHKCLILHFLNLFVHLPNLFFNNFSLLITFIIFFILHHLLNLLFLLFNLPQKFLVLLDVLK